MVNRSGYSAANIYQISNYVFVKLPTKAQTGFFLYRKLSIRYIADGG
jgi:hypothetical protein